MSSVALRAEDYQSVGQQSGEGYSVTLSPYDIPKEISVGIGEPGVVFIRFKYDDEEEAAEKSKELNPHVKLWVGKHSGKILSIQSDTEVFSADKSAVIPQSIAEAIPQLNKFNQQANYRVISSILSTHIASLISEIGKYLEKKVPA